MIIQYEVGDHVRIRSCTNGEQHNGFWGRILNIGEGIFVIKVDVDGLTVPDCIATEVAPC